MANLFLAKQPIKNFAVKNSISQTKNVADGDCLGGVFKEEGATSRGKVKFSNHSDCCSPI